MAALLAAAKGKKVVTGKPFVQLAQDRKANLALETLKAPSRWDQCRRAVDDSIRKALISCRCLVTRPRPPPQEDTHHPSLWHILPRHKHDLDELTTLILWSKEGPIPILINDNGTIADLKRQIYLQLWISSRLEVRLHIIENSEDVLDAVEAGEAVETKDVTDEMPVKPYTYIADSDWALQLSVTPKALKDIARASAEGLKQIRVRSSDLKQRRGVIVRPVGPSTTIGEIKEALLKDAPDYFAPVPDVETNPLRIHFSASVVYPDALMEDKPSSVIDDKLTLDEINTFNDDIVYLDFDIPVDRLA